VHQEKIIALRDPGRLEQRQRERECFRSYIRTFKMHVCTHGARCCR